MACLRIRLAVTATLVLSMAPMSVVRAGDASSWTQWRGAARDGSVEGTPWPEDLGTVQRMWRVELGRGYASPIVAPDRVFVAGSAADGAVTVRALDRASGREIWSHSWEAATQVPFFAASHGTWVRSTPVWDGATLYIGDMRENLLALDGDSGEVRWRLELPRTLGTGVPAFGFASSPLLADGSLYVQGGSSLLRIDPADGSVLWRALASDTDIMTDGAFSSPVIASIGGVRQVVVFTRTVLAGVAADSGEVLWTQEVPNFRGMNIVTPLVVGDSVFVSQYRNGSYRYDVTRGVGGFRTDLAWSQKASGYMSSPVLFDGHVYQHLGNGRLACIELASGTETWRTEPLGEYWSMLRQGSRILSLSAEGVLRLLQADPTGYRVVDEREVAATPTWGHVVADNGQLFVRELEALAVFAWSHRETVPANDAVAPAGR